MTLPMVKAVLRNKPCQWASDHGIEASRQEAPFTYSIEKEVLLIECKGRKRTVVTFDGNIVCIRRGRRVERRLPVAKIQSIWWRPGHIRFDMEGSTVSMRAYDKVDFSRRQTQEFLALRDAIESAIIETHGGPRPEPR